MYRTQSTKRSRTTSTSSSSSNTTSGVTTAPHTLGEVVFSPTVDAAYKALKRVVVALDECRRTQHSIGVPLASSSLATLADLSSRYTTLVNNIVTVVQSVSKALSEEILFPQDVRFNSLLIV